MRAGLPHYLHMSQHRKSLVNDHGDNTTQPLMALTCGSVKKALQNSPSGRAAAARAINQVIAKSLENKTQALRDLNSLLRREPYRTVIAEYPDEVDDLPGMHLVGRAPLVQALGFNAGVEVVELLLKAGAPLFKSKLQKQPTVPFPLSLRRSIAPLASENPENKTPLDFLFEPRLGNADAYKELIFKFIEKHFVLVQLPDENEVVSTPRKRGQK